MPPFSLLSTQSLTASFASFLKSKHFSLSLHIINSKQQTRPPKAASIPSFFSPFGDNYLITSLSSIILVRATAECKVLFGSNANLFSIRGHMKNALQNKVKSTEGVCTKNGRCVALMPAAQWIGVSAEVKLWAHLGAPGPCWPPCRLPNTISNP